MGTQLKFNEFFMLGETDKVYCGVKTYCQSSFTTKSRVIFYDRLKSTITLFEFTKPETLKEKLLDAKAVVTIADAIKVVAAGVVAPR